MSNLNTCLRNSKIPLGPLGASLEMPLPQVFEVKSPRRRPRPSDNDWTLLLKRVTETKIRRNPLFSSR